MPSISEEDNKPYTDTESTSKDESDSVDIEIITVANGSQYFAAGIDHSSDGESDRHGYDIGAGAERAEDILSMDFSDENVDVTQPQDTFCDSPRKQPRPKRKNGDGNGTSPDGADAKRLKLAL